MKTRIALVQTHQNMLRILLQIVYKSGLNLVKWRQNLIICIVGIDSIYFPILITALIIDINQAVIPYPEIACNVPLSGVCDSCYHIGPYLLHMNIHPVFPRLLESQLSSVRRYLEAGHSGISEEIFHGNQRYRLLLIP